MIWNLLGNISFYLRIEWGVWLPEGSHTLQPYSQSRSLAFTFEES